MRKNASFTIAAIGLVLLLTFWASHSVVGSGSNVARTRAPHAAQITSFLPFDTVEPSR